MHNASLELLTQLGRFPGRFVLDPATLAPADAAPEP